MRRVVLFFLFGLLEADDAALRDKALEHGLKPLPFEHLRKLPSHEMIELGKKLFFEKKLSKNRDISCASCHDIHNGGIDGLETAVGERNQPNPKHLNTPTILNAVFSKHYFWDGRSGTLSDQAKGPLQAGFEMASSPKLIVSRLYEDGSYEALFNEAFGSSEITFEKTAEAIGAYEHTLITRSRYDEFLEGNLKALSFEETKGLELYIQNGCVGCHNGIGLGGQYMRKFPLLHHPIWSMTNQKTINEIREFYLEFLQNTKVPKEQRYNYLLEHLGIEKTQLLRKGYFEFYDEEKSYELLSGVGCYDCHAKRDFSIDKATLKERAFIFKNYGGFLGKEKASRYFRVPLLRNVVKTAPYFHNGSVKTLREAVKIMLTYQSRKNVSNEDIDAITAFLKAVDSPLHEE